MKYIVTVFIAGFFAVSCGNKSQDMKIEAAKQAVVDSVNTANAVKQRTIDSMNAVHEAREARVARNTQTRTTTTTVVQEEPKKKGWSSAAKGAVIGAGAGAITGAMVDKKKGEGAIVGGLLGAGAGAATGAIIDNSKKKKNQ